MDGLYRTPGQGSVGQGGDAGDRYGPPALIGRGRRRQIRYSGGHSGLAEASWLCAGGVLLEAFSVGRFRRLQRGVVSLLGVAAVSLRATVGSEAIPSVAGWRLLRHSVPRNDKSSPFQRNNTLQGDYQRR